MFIYASQKCFENGRSLPSPVTLATTTHYSLELSHHIMCSAILQQRSVKIVHGTERGTWGKNVTPFRELLLCALATYFMLRFTKFDSSHGEKNTHQLGNMRRITMGQAGQKCMGFDDSNSGQSSFK